MELKKSPEIQNWVKIEYQTHRRYQGKRRDPATMVGFWKNAIPSNR